jgi:hypothetical protein
MISVNFSRFSFVFHCSEWGRNVRACVCDGGHSIINIPL